MSTDKMDLEALPDRVERLELKVDALSATMDRRFDEVTEALVEQRSYTEFAFAKVEKRLSAVEGRLSAVEGRLGAVEGRLGAVEGRLGAVEERMVTVDHIERLERKLDQFIDVALRSTPRTRKRR